MTRDISSKQRLLAWAEDADLEFRTRYILEKLCSFAGPARETWAPVSYLAKVAQCSERKVQYCLSKLKEDGFIAQTSKRHRLEDSTRSVPIYRVAPGWNAEMTAETMGANGAPIDPAPEADGCKDQDLWVHRACTPKEPIEPTEFANAHGAREREALVEGYRALEAATPRRVLAETDPDEALAAYLALAADGVDVADLPGCAQRWGQDPGFKTRKFPPGLHVWLAKRQYRGWLPEAAPEPSHVVAEAAPDAIPAEIVEGLGGAFMANWAPGARWIAEDRTIVTRLKLQAEKIRAERAEDLARLAVRVTFPAELAALQHQQGATP